MERMDNALTRLPANGQRTPQSNLPDGSRLRAVMALIQRCRVLSGLTPLQDSDMALYLPTWTQTLQEIPDALLMASFDKASAIHEWPKPFPVPAIVNAYKQLIIEDREQRERNRYINERRNPDTVACRLCGDTGYAPLAVWCRSLGNWRTGRAACECEATPLPQRRSSLIDPHEWKRDDFGTWFPPSSAASPDCICLFCKKRPTRK